MEGNNVGARNPKRARDDGEDKPESSSSSSSSSTSSSSSYSSHKSKKQEFLIDFVKVNEDKDKEDGDSYNFCDGIGVFDFPWLKDDSSVVFQVEDYLEPNDTFALGLDNPAGDYYYTGKDGNLWELGFDGGCEGLWSWKLEDFKSVEDEDCVWGSSLIDDCDRKCHVEDNMSSVNQKKMQ